MKKYCLMLFAVFFVAACGSGDLTRSKAKRIMEKRPEPSTIAPMWNAFS